MTRFAACLTFLCLPLLFVACAAATFPSAGDLLHRRFVLESLDGKPFTSSMGAPDIEFNEGFRLSGRICNRYSGQASLENGLLLAPHMAMTKMLCPDEALNDFETLFGSMLGTGAQVTFSGNTLTLRQGTHVLVYKSADWVR